MEKEKKQLLEKTYREFIRVGIESDDPNLFAGMVDNNVFGYGTAIDEKIFGLEEFKKLLIIQKKQSKGIQMTWRNEPIDLFISEDTNTAVFAEDIYLNIKTGEENLEMYVRFSCVLNFSNKQWKVVHWHSSKPEQVESEKDTWGLESYKQKAEELERLVEEKTADLVEKNKALKIEAALEKTRTQSMLMQHSNEVNQISKVFHEQLLGLGIDSEFSFVWLPDEEKNEHLFWATWQSEKNGSPEIQSKSIVYPMDLSEPTTLACLTDWKSGVSVHEHFIPPSEIKNFFASWEELLDGAEKLNPEYFPDGIYYTEAFMKYGCFGIDIRRSLSEEEKNILFRFSIEFERAYTRFLDLQKAEAQAREAEIELALERVRARTMSMQTSEELADVAFILFEQLRSLGGNLWGTGFGLCEENAEKDEFWFANENGVFPSVAIPNNTDPAHKKMYQGWKKKIDFLSIEKSGKELKQHYDYMLSLPEVKPFFQKILDEGLSFPDKQQWNTAYFSKGYLLIITLEPYPEVDIFKRFAKVFEQTYTRFLDLQKAESQAREARIETALERVRSTTMAMHNSEDVEHAVITLFDEVLKLGLDKSIRCGIGILEGTDKMETWSANAKPNSKVTLRVGLLDMSIHPMLAGLKKAWTSGQEGYKYTFTKEDVRLYYEALNKEPDYPFNADMKKLPEKEFHNSYFFSSGIIFSFTENPISEEGNKVLKRFASVFDQTYTRFLDLQKAEAQTREAKIETALEKVRSRTMGMQNSDELPEVANLLFTEVRALGINAWSCGYNILAEDKKTATCCMSSEGTLQTPFQLRLWGEASFDEMGDFILSDKQILVQELGGKALEAHYAYMKSFPDLKPTFDEIDRLGFALPTYQINHLCKFNQGFILFITYEKVPDAQDIFKRFTKVFDQTYTRFLDLQKAEAQVREAKIEAALERIRSHAMGMQNSGDLGAVTTEMFDQLRSFGEDLFAAGIVFCDKHEGHVEQWHSIPGGGMLSPFIVPVDLDYIHQYRYDQWKAGNDLFSVEIPGNFIEQHFQDIFNLPSAQIALKDLESRNAPMPETPKWEIDYGASFKNGYILISSLKHLQSADILPRFARVFEQAYTRFLDLQKAEASAKEAIKQTSLDRVRAEIASMRSTEDLQRITPLIWKELTTLEVPFFRCGVFIIDEKDEKINMYLSAPDGHSLGALSLAFDVNDLTQNAVANWRQKKVYRVHWDKEIFTSWMKNLEKEGQITDARTYQDAEKAPESLDLHFVPFKQGLLYVGNDKPLSDEKLDLVRALAESFSIAYARYEDFNQLDLAKQEIEKTLVNLKQAQKQLIQSEKMASLGELTAGIAHEIQNPLNFVNNFSEVSNELIQEIQEERAKKNEERDEELVSEIFDDLKQNLEKINQHGKRADAIVKGMLEHSRINKGEKALTDLNVLADEFVRLSYHGLRAKDKSFNANFNLDLDPALPKVNVVAQDLGRVILNLVNNAFYAVNEKAKSGIEGYQPEITVRSKKTEKGLELSVQDNGNGIPDTIKEKVFQPFFTTKPTGSGTGLGLSLSYDIVKAHGGTIKLENSTVSDKNKKTKGTCFTISLPIEI